MDEACKGEIAYLILMRFLSGCSGKFQYEKTKEAIILAERIGGEDGKEFARIIVHDLTEKIYM